MSRRARPSRIAPLLLALFLPGLAYAGGTAVVPPLVPKGIDAKVATNVSGLISSELDFSGAYETVNELSPAPASLNVACLSSAPCLAAIAKGAGADAVLAGSVGPGPQGVQVYLVLYDAAKNSIIRKQTFDCAADAGTLADSAGKWVKQLVTGQSPAAAAVAEAPPKFDASSEDDGFEFDKSSAKTTGSSSKSPIQTKAQPRALTDDEDDGGSDAPPARTASSSSSAADAKAKAAADAKAKADAEARAKAKAEADARAQAQADADAKAEAAAEAKAAADAKAKADADRKARQEAEQAEADAEAAKDRAREEAREKAEAARRAREEADSTADAEPAPAPAKASASSASSSSSAKKPAAASGDDDFQFGSSASLIAIEPDDSAPADDDTPAPAPTRSTSSSSSASRSTSSSRPSSTSARTTSSHSSDDEDADTEDAPVADDEPVEHPDFEEDDDRPSHSSSSHSSSSSSHSSSSSSHSSGSSSHASHGDDHFDEGHASRSTAHMDDAPTKPGVALSGRVGYSHLYSLNFITYGGELSIPVAPVVQIIAGIEGYSTQQVDQDALQALVSDGAKPSEVDPPMKWHMILPINLGVLYKNNANSVHPYAGADLTVTPYTENFDLAFGGRARAGADFMVAKNFGFNLNLSVGVMWGDKFSTIQTDAKSVSVIPQVSGGTVFQF